MMKKGFAQEMDDGHERKIQFEDILTIFAFVNDKDVFFKVGTFWIPFILGPKNVLKFFQTQKSPPLPRYYSSDLAARIIHNLTHNDEDEENLINLIKDKCGYETVSKLLRMLKDKTQNQELGENFENYLGGPDYKNDRDAGTIVLTSQQAITNNGKLINTIPQILSKNQWPGELLPKSELLDEIKWPTPFQDAITVFEKYYHGRHESRKLTWIPHQSKIDLVATFNPKAKTARYTFTSSIYQASILLMFNEKLNYTVDEIQKATGLHKKILDQVLGHLIRRLRILKIETKSAEESSSQGQGSSQNQGQGQNTDQAGADQNNNQMSDMPSTSVVNTPAANTPASLWDGSNNLNTNDPFSTIGNERRQAIDGNPSIDTANTSLNINSNNPFSVQSQPNLLNSPNPNLNNANNANSANTANNQNQQNNQNNQNTNTNQLTQSNSSAGDNKNSSAKPGHKYTTLQLSDTILLNTEYKHKNKRMHIYHVPLNTEQKQEEKRSQKAIEEDRKHEIQCCLGFWVRYV